MIFGLLAGIALIVGVVCAAVLVALRVQQKDSDGCLGIVGAFFGHKYIKTKDAFVYQSDACYRCGKRRGQR